MNKKSKLLLLLLGSTIALSACNTKKPNDDTNDTGDDVTDVVDDSNIMMNGVAYTSIKSALQAIPEDSTEEFVIKLKKGKYTENALYYTGKATIHIIGDTNAKYGEDVIIEGRGSNMSSMNGGRELLEVFGEANIILENITLLSDLHRTETTKDVQAEVLATNTTGYTVAYNCSFKSHQDTIRTTGKAWFYECYIEGDTDFIWMDSKGTVALYEKCQIVSLYDEFAKTHSSYVSAPRMNISNKVGKGLVYLNSTIKESAEAKKNGQSTYLARSPWTSGYYNQVAYINTMCFDIETDLWYGKMIPTDYQENIIGWKIDSKTALILGVDKGNFIIDDATTNKEFNGRNAILNRIYNIDKQRYESDGNNWDINALIAKLNINAAADQSKSVLDGEEATNPTVYTFDGTTDLSGICNGFTKDNDNAYYVGNEGATITLPVNGKCFVEIYGSSGVLEAKANTQGSNYFVYNNSKAITEKDYIVFNSSATEVVITAKEKATISKIVVVPNTLIGDEKKVTQVNVSADSSLFIVGLNASFKASVNKDATNKNVIWSSSNTNIAEINPYTGEATFKAEGTVDFTATACDGSNVKKSITCISIIPNWNSIEWYTKDGDLANEANASGIEYFVMNTSTKKAIGKEYTYKNLNGDDFTTSTGLKLDSKGLVTFATIKPTTLTIVTCDAGKLDAALSVTNGDTVAALTATRSDNGTITYVYELEQSGIWSIQRGDGNQENNPILYMKVETK